jgi:hypothetical protein
MKRDMDLIRNILFAMEESKQTYFTDHSLPEMEGRSSEVVYYHMKIMSQANLLNCEKVIHENEVNIGNHQTKTFKHEYDKFSISWHGHEFLDALRDDNQWKKIKKTMSKAGGFITEIAIDIAKETIKQAATKAIFQ